MTLRLKQKPLDKIDLKILQALQADGRMTNRTLSKQVALSPSACLARVNQLERSGIIAGYHASIDTERVRPTLLVLAEVMFGKHTEDLFAVFDAMIMSTPEVVEAYRVSGTVDYIIKFVVSDIQEWRDVAEKVLSADFKVEKMTSHIVVIEAKRFKGYPILVAEHQR